MANKNSRGAKSTSKSSSSKTSPRKKYSLPAKRTASRKPAPKKRVSYKAEYVKLLERTNKTFTKEIKAIRDAVVAHPPQVQPPQFPFTGRGRRTETANATINDVLEQLNAIQGEISQRNRMLDELIEQPGKK